MSTPTKKKPTKSVKPKSVKPKTVKPKTTKPKSGISIEGQGISKSQLKQLKDFLGNHLSENIKLRQEGKRLTLSFTTEGEISKTKLKPYLKRFLYLENLRTKVRILTDGPAGLKLYQPGYIEEAE